LTAEAAPESVPAGTVLVIEDDEFVRRLIERVLSGAGYCVFSAASGAAGVALLRAQRKSVRCIMLDATLPDLGGSEALRQLIGIRGDVPIVLATGRAPDEVAPLRAMSARITYLMKPFAPDQILAGVRQALAE
jgi:DNA-binding response OmpR family regulator